jgi:EmrB/QacA subfamily drug resistance transporter
VLSIGLFMIMLDGTIVSIAIPHIMGTYDTSLSNAEWVMNSYSLMFAVTLVTLGRFGDLYGRRRLFLGGMVLFTASSLGLGLSPDVYWLIGFSVVQGLGGAAMMPATLSIIAVVFSADRRLAAMGVWGTVSGVSMAIGPSIGGLLIDVAGWRSIFLINVPLGLVGTLLALRVVPESKNPTAVETLDLPGVGLISAALFCLTFAVVEGQRYGWTSATIIGLFAAAAAGFVVFYFRENAVHQPLIDFTLFRHIDFVAGNVISLLLGAAMMAVFFTIPIFLQSVLGYSALKTGLVLSPTSVAIVAATPLAGHFSRRFGSRWTVAAGMLALAGSLAWLAGLVPWQATLTPDTPLTHFLIPFTLGGVGIGLSIAPVTSAVMATVPRDQVGAASGVLSTTRQMGTLMGIAMLGAVLQSSIARNAREGVTDLQGVPAPIKQRIIAEIGSVEQMVADLPVQFQNTVSHAFRAWYTDAVSTSLAVGAVIAVVGGVAALLLRGHVGDIHEESAAEALVDAAMVVARSESVHRVEDGGSQTR